jgi:hypothetical protein
VGFLFVLQCWGTPFPPVTVLLAILTLPSTSFFCKEDKYLRHSSFRQTYDLQGNKNKCDIRFHGVLNFYHKLIMDDKLIVGFIYVPEPDTAVPNKFTLKQSNNERLPSCF